MKEILRLGGCGARIEQITARNYAEPDALVAPANQRARASKSSAAGLLLTSRGLRAFGDGLVSLLLPVYLAQLGLSALEIGALVTATLAGSSILTLSVGLAAHRFSGRGFSASSSGLQAVQGVTRDGGRPRSADGHRVSRCRKSRPR